MNAVHSFSKGPAGLAMVQQERSPVRPLLPIGLDLYLDLPIGLDMQQRQSQ